MQGGKARIREGALSALKTPTNPPAPTKLVPLLWGPRRTPEIDRSGSSAIEHLAATPEGLIATVVALDASPANVLRAMRGEIVDARIAYPEVLHVEIKDSDGELWRLATQDAEWSPSDPADLVGRSVDDADIDGETGELRCKLSDGSILDVRPAAQEAEDNPPNWELITPGGVVLEFGPGVRWQIGSADSRASARA